MDTYIFFDTYELFEITIIYGCYNNIWIHTHLINYLCVYCRKRHYSVFMIY